jgi:hypothetical protein
MTNGSYPRKKRTINISAVPNWNAGEVIAKIGGNTLNEACFGFRRNLCRNLSRREFIHIAPDPCFSGFNRADERMFAAMEMLSRVLVLR